MHRLRNPGVPEEEAAVRGRQGADEETQRGVPRDDRGSQACRCQVHTVFR